MTSSVKGSAFNFGDNGVFYSAIDFGCRTNKTAAENTAKVTAALIEIEAAGGGILLIPQGIMVDAITFPVTAIPLAIWNLMANDITWKGNQDIKLTIAGSIEVSKNVKLLGDLTVRGELCLSQQIVAPATGASIQMGDGIQKLTLNHAATIASLNVALPENPTDGATCGVFARNEVTALNLYASAGSSIEAGHTISALAAGQSVGYIFNAATAKWFRT